MIKDGIAEKVKRQLHRLYDAVLDEPVPGSMSDLIAKLDGKK